MRRIWFLFKIIESLLGLCCLGYHARGFLNNYYIQDHYIYVAVFGGFSLMAMCGCLGICLKEPVSPVREGVLSMIAATAFILVSINSMYHAEKDFHLMYLQAAVKEEILDEYQKEADLSEQPHPFFKYSKAQSVAALTCGSLFLLHSILAFDLVLTEGSEETDFTDDETSDIEICRMPYYVFGKKVHIWLNRFEWFNSLADTYCDEKIDELIEIRY